MDEEGVFCDGKLVDKLRQTDVSYVAPQCKGSSLLDYAFVISWCRKVLQIPPRKDFWKQWLSVTVSFQKLILNLKLELPTGHHHQVSW